MAFKIIWTELAREDLREIILYIAQDNPIAAESFGYLLISRVDLLQNFPELGRIVPEKGDPKIRELIYRSHRIIYQMVDEHQVIAIVRIWHGARGEPDLPRE